MFLDQSDNLELIEMSLNLEMEFIQLKSELFLKFLDSLSSIAIRYYKRMKMLTLMRKKLNHVDIDMLKLRNRIGVMENMSKEEDKTVISQFRSLKNDYNILSHTFSEFKNKRDEGLDQLVRDGEVIFDYFDDIQMSLDGLMTIMNYTEETAKKLEDIEDGFSAAITSLESKYESVIVEIDYSERRLLGELSCTRRLQELLMEQSNNLLKAGKTKKLGILKLTNIDSPYLPFVTGSSSKAVHDARKDNLKILESVRDILTQLESESNQKRELKTCISMVTILMATILEYAEASVEQFQQYSTNGYDGVSTYCSKDDLTLDVGLINCAGKKCVLPLIISTELKNRKTLCFKLGDVVYEIKLNKVKREFIPVNKTTCMPFKKSLGSCGFSRMNNGLYRELSVPDETNEFSTSSVGIRLCGGDTTYDMSYEICSPYYTINKIKKENWLMPIHISSCPIKGGQTHKVRLICLDSSEEATIHDIKLGDPQVLYSVYSQGKLIDYSKNNIKLSSMLKISPREIKPVIYERLGNYFLVQSKENLYSPSGICAIDIKDSRRKVVREPLDFFDFQKNCDGNDKVNLPSYIKPDMIRLPYERDGIKYDRFHIETNVETDTYLQVSLNMPIKLKNKNLKSLDAFYTYKIEGNPDNGLCTICLYGQEAPIFIKSKSCALGSLEKQIDDSWCFKMKNFGSSNKCTLDVISVQGVTKKEFLVKGLKFGEETIINKRLEENNTEVSVKKFLDAFSFLGDAPGHLFAGVLYCSSIFFFLLILCLLVRWIVRKWVSKAKKRNQERANCHRSSEATAGILASYDVGINRIPNPVYDMSANNSSIGYVR